MTPEMQKRLEGMSSAKLKDVIVATKAADAAMAFMAAMTALPVEEALRRSGEGASLALTIRAYNEATNALRDFSPDQTKWHARWRIPLAALEAKLQSRAAAHSQQLQPVPAPTSKADGWRNW